VVCSVAFAVMQERVGHPGGSSYTPRYGDSSCSYNAEAHLRWLLGLPQVSGLLEHLRQAAENPRRHAGLPWREYGFLDTEGDAAAIERWRGEQRRLSHLLPPKLRKLLPLLVRDPDAPIEIAGGRGLSPERAGRLQALCRRKLIPSSPALSNRERQQLYRDLRALDPSREPLLILPGKVLARGATTAICATSAARGSWAAFEPQPAYPNVGVVATYSDTGTGIEPFPLADGSPMPAEKFEFFRETGLTNSQT
jgi:hypothetical protein